MVNDLNTVCEKLDRIIELMEKEARNKALEYIE